MLRAIPVLVLVTALLLTSGCTEHAPASVFPSDGLSASVSQVEDHWNPGLGCYWRVYGSVFNSGDGMVNGVVVYIELIDVATGAIRDSKTIAVGNLPKGGSRAFEVSLDGECDHPYRVEVRPVAGP